MTAFAAPGGFGRLWSASLLANLSDGIRAAAFPLLAAQLTRDPVLVAGVAVAQQVPWLVSGPLSGVIVDRVDRRRVLWTVNAVRAAVFAALAVSVVAGTVHLPVLYLAAVALGIGESLYDNAAQTVVPDLVAPEHLERANGRLVAAEVAGNEFVGPPLGAMLFGIAVVLPFAGGAGGLVVAAVLVVGLAGTFRPRLDVPAAGGMRGVWTDLVAGVAFVRRHRQLGTVTVLAAVLSAADAAWFAVLVLYGLEVLGLSEAGFGLLLAVGAVGGIAGAAVAGRVGGRLPLGGLLGATLLLSAVTQLGLGLTPHVPVAVGLVALSSLAFGVWNVLAVSLRQRVTPPALLGRVNATYRSAAMGAAPLGAALGGLAASQLGLRAPFLLGVPFLVAGALLAATRLRGP